MLLLCNGEYLLEGKRGSLREIIMGMEEIYLDKRTATILALGAAIAGALFSLYHGIVSFINLARLGLPGFHLVLQFLASNDWIGYGYIFLFVMILFFPRIQRLGAVGVIGGGLIRLFFAVFSLLSLITESALDKVGSFRLVYILSPVWAIIVVVFGIFWAVNPNSTAVRIVALLVGFSIVANLLIRLVIAPFNLATVISILISSFIAQWFILLFFRRPAGDSIYPG